MTEKEIRKRWPVPDEDECAGRTIQSEQTDILVEIAAQLAALNEKTANRD